MDFGGLLILAALWLFVKLVGRSREGSTKAPPRRPVPPVPTGPTSGADPTQLEGSQLEMLLRELGRAMEQGRGGSGPMGRPAPQRLPPAEEVEERESLEVGPRVESLETEVRRPARAPVDQDDQAEQVIARRAAATAARSGPITRADHAAFDQRIRQEPADHTAVRPLTPQQLRDAVVWREILGPPVSEREP